MMKAFTNYEYLSHQEITEIEGGRIIGPFFPYFIGIKMGERLIDAFDDFKAGLLGQPEQ
jgi:hypothetical protein